MPGKIANRAAEVKAVKVALAKAGINARVAHGRGTAWGWLEVNVGAGADFGPHAADSVSRCPSTCFACNAQRKLSARALKITLEVTGRSGEYNGRINIYTQDHWNQAKKVSEPIGQAEFKAQLEGELERARVGVVAYEPAVVTNAEAKPAEKTVTLTLSVTFDPEHTDAESLATALDKLLGTALCTPGILDDYGTVDVGEFLAPAES